MTGNGTTDGTERTTVGLEVQYNASSEPCLVKFFHNTFGMMKFDVDGRTAVIDPEWHQIGDGDLKDEFDRWITTGDVIHSVQQLPFVDEVDASQVWQYYEELIDNE